ncbi:hypothetical protein CNY89_26840, partial [Amaricoccus sp. HAR-UPW-R2A-40]
EPRRVGGSPTLPTPDSRRSDLDDGENRCGLDALDGLAANGPDANDAVEAAVKAKVQALCDRFPIYPGL